MRLGLQENMSHFAPLDLAHSLAFLASPYAAGTNVPNGRDLAPGYHSALPPSVNLHISLQAAPPFQLFSATPFCLDPALLLAYFKAGHPR